VVTVSRGFAAEYPTDDDRHTCWIVNGSGV
jgi:hypothetical protein